MDHLCSTAAERVERLSTICRKVDGQLWKRPRFLWKGGGSSVNNPPDCCGDVGPALWTSCDQAVENWAPAVEKDGPSCGSLGPSLRTGRARRVEDRIAGVGNLCAR